MAEPVTPRAHDHPVVEDLNEIHRKLLAARAKLEQALRRCP